MLCDDDPCGGACCSSYGESCAPLGQAQCPDLPGSLFIFGAQCGPGVCDSVTTSLPLGLCCWQPIPGDCLPGTVNCEVYTQAQCDTVSQGGNPLGWNPEITEKGDCSECECTAALGSCCDTRTGSCENDTRSTNCNQWYHRWEAFNDCDQRNTPCEILGACCVDELGTCQNGRTASQCSSPSTWHPGVLCGTFSCTNPPPPTGACCLTDGSCRDSQPGLLQILEAECSQLGGRWLPEMTCQSAVCDNNATRGSCCTNAGCRYTTQSECAAINAVFHPNVDCFDSPCDPPEPCGCEYQCRSLGGDSYAWLLLTNTCQDVGCGSAECASELLAATPCDASRAGIYYPMPCRDSDPI